ncbi:VWA domain-containing protein [Granulicella sp. dw_53]|uniref:VWA domain-containing protein n=1 Tax=Granulicella sp. dw_53 TaxID=2719792 RepID=UPI001BD5F045|nr:VWA domain-containing protein [Granulicella sp. dw_53]
MRPLLHAVLLTTLTAAALAQDTTLHTTTTLVVVPTLVQTTGKDVVYTLTANDFLLTDNAVPQKIKLEPSSTQPLSLVVLIQTGGAAIREFQHYSALETMLASLLEHDTKPRSKNQVSIVNFDSKPEGASPFTSNVAEWTDAINHPEPGDDGAAILDAISYSLRLLDDQPATNRRAILLISQPTDVGSKTPLKEILRTTAETNTTIYTLTFSPEKAAFQNAFKDKAHLNPPIVVNPAAGPIQGYFNLSEPLGLILGSMRKNLAASIAPLTGGEAATFDDQHSLDEDLGTLATHIRNRYLITFQPASPQPGLHKLEVRLPQHPELTVSARTNYWSAEPDPSPVPPPK